MASAVFFAPVIYFARLSDFFRFFPAELHRFFGTATNLPRLYELFIIFFDFLSSLRALISYRLNNPLVIEMFELCNQLFDCNKSIVFACVPSDVDIPGNTKVDNAAKAAMYASITTKYWVRTIKQKVKPLFITCGKASDPQY